MNRLSSVDYGDGQTQSYAFDAMGNRTQRVDSVSGTTAYAFDSANRLTSAGGNAYTNDAGGNTLTGGGRTNAWDAQNRLVSSLVSGTSSAFTYGADGLRRSGTVTPSGGSATTTRYCYDGQTMVRSLRQNGQGAWQAAATYLTGPRGMEYRRDDLAGTVRWYVYDGLGSVVGELDPAGNLTAGKKYDVYGAERTGGTGTASSRQGYVGSLGHVSDAETGLVYMRARYYDPNLGRFESEDVGKSGINWFAYCSNSPSNRIDVTGCDDTLASVSVGMDGAITMEGVPGLAALDATLTGQVGDIAMIDVKYIEAAAKGRIGFRTMFSAIKTWASGAGITKIYMQAVGGSDEGKALMEKFSGFLQVMGDKGELQANDPYTMIYWMMQ